MLWWVLEATYRDADLKILEMGEIISTYCRAVAYRGRGKFGVVQTPPRPPPKFRSLDKVEPDCKLSGKCLVFLFQHPN